MTGLRILWNILLSLLILAVAALAGFALWYRAPFPAVLTGLWAIFGVGVFLGVWRQDYHKRAIGIFIAAMAVMLLWWSTIEPRADRAWSPEVAYLATGDVQGRMVTLNNVRNFTWRNEDNDYDVRWETRSYNLDDITGVDLFLTYWGMPAIAHTMIGFSFGNGDHVVFSVETRKENGEQYSSVAGFFKQYELALIAADERDIVYLRTNVRGEDVYRFPLGIKPDGARKLFLSYLRTGQRLNEKPAFYNTLTANCTTIVFEMAKAINGRLPFDYRVLASGYLPAYLSDKGERYKGQNVDDMMAAAYLNKKAMAAGYSVDFSRQIRQ